MFPVRMRTQVTGDSVLYLLKETHAIWARWSDRQLAIDGAVVLDDKIERSLIVRLLRQGDVWPHILQLRSVDL